MKENIELGRHREFGDILSDTVVVVKQNFKPLLKSYFVICGLFLLADILISGFVNGGNASVRTLWGMVELIFDLVNYISLTLIVLVYLVLYKEKGNQPPNVLEVWGYFKYYFFRVFFTQILLAIAACVGFLFCFLPGIYLSVVFALVVPIMVVENGSIEYSFKKAFKIIKDNWWFTFGTLLLITIIILMCMLILMLPAMIIYGGTQWLTGENLDRTVGILQAIAINFCQILWIVPVISTALLYYSFTEEKEGASLIDRIKKFGKTGPGTDQITSEQY